MFGQDEKQMARALDAMIEQARADCRYNQSEMVKRMADWISADRRFDHMNAHGLASEALDARQHGRQIKWSRA
jgi:hypothetical protein